MDKKTHSHDHALLRAMFRVSGITARDISFVMGVDPVLVLDWAIGLRSLTEYQVECLALLLGLEDGDIEDRMYYLNVGEDLRHLATVIARTSIGQQGFSLKQKPGGRALLRSGGATLIIGRSAGVSSKLEIEKLLM